LITRFSRCRSSSCCNFPGDAQTWSTGRHVHQITSWQCDMRSDPSPLPSPAVLWKPEQEFPDSREGSSAIHWTRLRSQNHSSEAIFGIHRGFHLHGPNRVHPRPQPPPLPPLRRGTTI
jgi:hypothetical protein